MITYLKKEMRLFISIWLHLSTLKIPVTFHRFTIYMFIKNALNIKVQMDIDFVQNLEHFNSCANTVMVRTCTWMRKKTLNNLHTFECSRSEVFFLLNLKPRVLKYYDLGVFKDFFWKINDFELMNIINCKRRNQTHEAE